MNSPEEFGKYLDELIKRGPALREAGFLSFDMHEFGEVKLVPAAGSLLPVLRKQGNGSEVEAGGDPLDDPMSYGLQPGEKLPWRDGYSEEGS